MRSFRCTKASNCSATRSWGNRSECPPHEPALWPNQEEAEQLSKIFRILPECLVIEKPLHLDGLGLPPSWSRSDGSASFHARSFSIWGLGLRRLVPYSAAANLASLMLSSRHLGSLPRDRVLLRQSQGHGFVSEQSS